MANKAFYLLTIALFLAGLRQTSAQQFSILTAPPAKDQPKAFSNATKTDATPSSVAAPIIAYETPQNYVVNKAISPLSPVNSGGAVPAAIYGQTTTVSGSSTIPYYSTVTGVAIDANGQLFVADWDDSKIKVVDAAGIPSVFAGNLNGYITSTLSSTDKVSCTYINLDNTCVAQYPVTSNAVITQITKASNPTVFIAASVNFVFPGTNITFSATVNDADNPVAYNWLVNGLPAGTNSATFSSNTLQNNDKVTVVITDANTCSVPVTSNPLTVTIVDHLVIPNTFTPNGDGINDTWNINGLISYTECRVNVYDRYGRPVYQSSGYGQPWDGTKNGALIPASTYYYVINLGAINVPETKFSGSITILR